MGSSLFGSSDSSAEPQFFGEYQVLEHLGGGTFADVYRVRPRAVAEQQYALKVLRDPSNQRSCQRMENEAFVLKTVHHRCLPAYVASGKDPSPYVVMQLMNGTPVRERIKQSPMAPEEVVRVIEGLLETLAALHDLGIVHRDIKDDNVLISASSEFVALVDFGFCYAINQPVDPATFGDVGAAVYSPPSKLHYPSDTNPKHDVFAVGVLAYYLLTGQFPWWLEDGDRGHLLQTLESEEPRPLLRLAPHVPRDLNTFVHDLINIHDERRPDAKQAFNRLHEILTLERAPDVRRAVYSTTRPVCPRVFRDPVHGDIRLTEFEWSVIRTPEFQRLGYIRQLGTAHYVFRGALHSRMLHAIGTLHIVNQIINNAEEAHADIVDDSVRLQARLYALVHDVCHIAFGHTLEDELGIFERHDRNHARADRLLHNKSQLAVLLRQLDYGRAVIQHFAERPSQRRQDIFVEQMIGSSFGADVIDYVDRDAYFCGTDEHVDTSVYRRFRILRSEHAEDRFSVKLTGKYGLRMDALAAIQKILQARYELYQKVYTHPAKVCAGAMLGKAVYLAITAGRSGRAELSEEQIERLGDDELLLALRQSRRMEVRSLAERLWRRAFFAPAYCASVAGSTDGFGEIADLQQALEKKGLATPEGRANVEHAIASAIPTIKASDLIVYATPYAPGYGRLRMDLQDKLPDQVVSELNAIRARHLRLWKVYVFSADPSMDVRRRIAMRAQELLGYRNVLPHLSTRTGLLFG